MGKVYEFTGINPSVTCRIKKSRRAIDMKLEDEPDAETANDGEAPYILR